MSFHEKYRKSKAAGYSDEEIFNFLEKNDPNFSEKMQRSKDLGYSPKEVLDFFNSTPKKLEDSEDFRKQAAQGLGIGALGTYGDILDLFGLQPKETLPGEKAKNQMEFGILEKMQRPDYKPSPSDFLALSDDDDIIPRFSKLPSSHDIEKFGKELGVVSEPTSIGGRYGRRIGHLAGGGASLGIGGLTTPIVAGTAGQTLEEAGAPPWAQAAAEIIAALKVAPKSNVPITSKSKEVQNTIKNLRKSGYSEQDITLAKNALEEHKILKKYATLTPEAENTIRQGVRNSETLLKGQIKKGLPGYAEGGLSYLEKQASNVYKSMEELASGITVRNKEPVKKAIENSIAYLEKYPLLDEQKKFVEFLKDGLTKLDKADTAEFFTGFYRNLGKAGNWGNPTQKEHLLGLVKEGIKDTFAESGPEAAKFGKYFEITNEVWKHWLDTRDLMETIEKAFNIEGVNFKKIGSILNDPKNHDLARKVLGPEQLENIKTISQGAEAIESLLKQIPNKNQTIASLKILEGIRALFTKDYKTLVGILGYDAAKRLSTNLLTDPSKQNIMKKIIIAAKNNSLQQAMILAQELVNESPTKEEAESRPKSLK